MPLLQCLVNPLWLKDLNSILTQTSLMQVCQDYDPKRFNFTKVPQKEILFQVDETAQTASFEHKAVLGSSPNLVLINVSPIEYGHVLLVPRVLDCLPQVRSSYLLRKKYSS